MKTLLLAIDGIAVAIAAFIGLALLAGAIVWLLWPIAIHAFPGLVAKGYLASDISIWTAISVTFITAILIKPTNVTKQ